MPSNNMAFPHEELQEKINRQEEYITSILPTANDILSKVPSLKEKTAIFTTIETIQKSIKQQREDAQKAKTVEELATIGDKHPEHLSRIFNIISTMALVQKTIEETAHATTMKILEANPEKKLNLDGMK